MNITCRQLIQLLISKELVTEENNKRAMKIKAFVKIHNETISFLPLHKQSE
jgi:hypothetical protein